MLRVIFLVVLTSQLFGFSVYGKDDFQLKLKKYQLEKNDLKKSLLLIDLATESENIHFAKIESLAKIILKKGHKNNNKREINSGKFVLAICLLNKGKSDLAKKYLNQCKRFFSNSESENMMAMIYNYLGHCDYKGARFNEAIDDYTKAKYLWGSLNNHTEANLSNSFIATCLVQMGHLDKAKIILNECIKDLLPFKKNRTLSNYYGQLGEIYSTEKRNKEAGLNFDRGAEYAYRSDDPATIARAQNYLAISSYYKGDIETAIEKFKISLNYRMQSGDVKLVCESYYNIGTLYYETKKYELSEEYFQLSIDEAKKHGLFQDQAEALLEISKIYKDQKIFDKALIYMTSYSTVKDKLFNQLKSVEESDGELVELLNQSQIMQEAFGRENELKIKLKTAKIKIRYVLLGTILLLGGIVFVIKKRN